MPPPSLNSSAVLITSAVDGNSSLNATSQHKQYVSNPLRRDLVLTVSVLLTATVVVGFVGNLCVLRFTNNEEKKPAKARSSNLNFFIRSLALSDVLGSLIGASLALAMMTNSSAFMTEMRCKVSRYFQSVFVYVTIFNLVVIGVERYICTCRPTSRPLSLKTVKKSVKGAWLSGSLAALVFSYPIELIRIDLDSTRYTLICDYNYDDPTSRVMQMFRMLFSYILPSIFLTVACSCIARMLWIGKANVISGQSQSTEKWRQRRKKATTELIVIIIAFIVPYLSFSIAVILKMNLSPSVDFQTNYLTSRAVTGNIIFLNSPINFVIHIKQLNGFSRALKGYFVCCGNYQVGPVENIWLGPAGKTKATAVRRAWEPERRRAFITNAGR